MIAEQRGHLSGLGLRGGVTFTGPEGEARPTFAFEELRLAVQATASSGRPITRGARARR